MAARVFDGGGAHRRRVGVEFPCEAWGGGSGMRPVSILAPRRSSCGGSWWRRWLERAGPRRRTAFCAAELCGVSGPRRWGCGVEMRTQGSMGWGVYEGKGSSACGADRARESRRGRSGVSEERGTEKGRGRPCPVGPGGQHGAGLQALAGGVRRAVGEGDAVASERAERGPAGPSGELGPRTGGRGSLGRAGEGKRGGMGRPGWRTGPRRRRLDWAARVWVLGWVSFVFLLFPSSFLSLIQTKFEFKYKFEFKPHSNN